jgi:7-cyano-7-deazaguanine reductase
MANQNPELKQLGAKSPIPEAPDVAELERVSNPHREALYLARFQAPEFTTLCPVTGQPDFARLVIDYAPAEYLVESKSLKLFLQSFRNHAAFHEDCTLHVAKRIVALIAPRWFRIAGLWNARGGIPIDVFWQTGEPPAALWLPSINDNAFTGRG